MTEILLRQAEANKLLNMDKVLTDPTNGILQERAGVTLSLSLRSTNRREDFVVNYRRHSINLAKRNHHLRARTTVGITRLDLDGPPHRNPDGKEIGPRHLHLYQEGAALKWAYEVPEDKFSNLDDFSITLKEFFIYVNVIDPPNIQSALAL